ncbi:MAG: valine--tRNA ligase [Bacteroidetes bacterium 4572_77]|nr:MAG: valine--tRNA ligase [Bacteroidetes bacterium 4572_77]
MQIPSRYQAKDIENKWYKTWLEKKYFHSEPDEREPFTIVIPPPNVTGVLHMGHMLNNTIQDVLVRRARMQGKNACWVPGTDHASIATEAKVVNHLKQQGIDKNDLTREEFMAHAWEWKEKHGGIILEQLKKLGASCDWDRTKFTMDKDLYESVIDVFIDLYDKGLIYRGVRMVNWDPQALTALSDEEVIHKEVKSKLYYIKYQIEGSTDQWVTIATTRPETILGDTAVCVHPEDERFAHLKGKSVLVPLINRSIPIIQDEYVDREFGTGCLKITPAHDINDYKLGLKFKLESIDIFNDNGTLNEAAQLYIGEDRFEVRKKISTELKKKGFLVKEEDYTNKVGFSERTDAVIEPKLSLQWYMKMQEMAKPALDIVMNDTVSFYPKNVKNTYRHWMENVKDWNISRQLWWGQQIPVYYLPNNEEVVAKSAEEALIKAKEKYPELKDLKLKDIKQDEDVLDTWFSSWLWPISVFDGIRNPDNKDINYYYPTNDLVTAPEILFFWVARMIMSGLEYKQEIPFKNVYFTGIVRDKLGRKMSKSLGNSPDPIKLMEEYGADGVRVGMLLTSPAGNDLPFDESLCEQGRNFSNKIWNALRLLKGWEVEDQAQSPAAKSGIQWIHARINQSLASIEDNYDKYRLSDALMTVYKLIWDDFCSNYLEIIKPPYQKPIDRTSYEETILIFEKLMKILHPFMPFLTEEIWHLLSEREDGNDIIISPMPKSQDFSKEITTEFEEASEVINNIRKIRKDKNIPNKDSLKLFYIQGDMANHSFASVITKLGNLETFEQTEQKPEASQSFMVKAQEYFIPLSDSVDVAAEIEKLEKEQKHLEGFLKGIEKKLSNERFVNNAPAQVVDMEKKKQADAVEKLQKIKEMIAGFEGL